MVVVEVVVTTVLATGEEDAWRMVEFEWPFIIEACGVDGEKEEFSGKVAWVSTIEPLPLLDGTVSDAADEDVPLAPAPAPGDTDPLLPFDRLLLLLIFVEFKIGT